MLCIHFIANAGLEELKAAVDQAKKTYQAASQKAKALTNVSPAQFYLVKGYEKAAEDAIHAATQASERLQAARTAYDAALEEHNAIRKQTRDRMHTVIEAFLHAPDEEDDEDDDDNDHLLIATDIAVDDVQLILTYDNGREEELFGAAHAYTDGLRNIAFFAGQPAQQTNDNQ